MSAFPALCAVASVLLAVGGIQAQQDESHIYSNVEYNEEGGDLLGVELSVTVSGSHVKGQLKIYEGGCAAPMEVSGSQVGTRIDLPVRAMYMAGSNCWARFGTTRSWGYCDWEKRENLRKCG